MRHPILIAALAVPVALPALAGELTLEEVRGMSDEKLYALAGTLSAEDETRLYEEAHKEFPEAALGLQSALNKLEKSERELGAFQAALETNEPSDIRALSELEPGTYFSLLRIVSVPSKEGMDMTVDERKSEAMKAGRETNRILRDFRKCKRDYRKTFGDG